MAIISYQHTSITVTSQKKLIICPVCLKNGKREILGEMLPDGSFSVLRFHKGETVIKGPFLEIVCKCGHTVYQKDSGEHTYQW